MFILTNNIDGGYFLLIVKFMGLGSLFIARGHDKDLRLHVHVYPKTSIISYPGLDGWVTSTRVSRWQSF